MSNAEQFIVASKLYDEGRYSEAFEQFLSLANQGDTSAMTRVACMYGEGKGVEYNFAASVNWDIKAAAAGSQTALVNLGISYRNIGDTRRAKEWFGKALQAGDGEAALELAKMYLVSDLEIDRVKNYLTLALQSTNICEASHDEAKDLLDGLNS